MGTQHRTVLPGVAKLARLLDDLDLSRAEFARLASEHGTHVDRVTVVQLLDGHISRVSVAVAVAIRGASKELGREIAVEEWLPRKAAA